jgi:DnaK suppressor protein
MTKMPELNRDRALNEIKDNLVSDRDRLLSRAKKPNEIKEISSGTTGDEYDQAQNELLEAMALDLNNRDMGLLEKINTALDRFMDNSYGVCDSCGENIPLGRLKALPTSFLCVDCQESEEMEDKLDNIIASFISKKEANA